ncbi:triose-phosphate isomerase [Bacteroidota bacterium]
MRKQIVAGNWKMNTTLQEGIELAKSVNNLVANTDIGDIGVVLAPPFTHITEIVKAVDTNKIGVSSQNCASEAKGAYTGEVSAEMIKSTGAQYAIIGHSERRTYYKESNEILNKKVKLALDNDLIPIFCIGELLDERKSGRHFNVVKTQLDEGVFDLTSEEFSKIVIAYEPVWAIGTGEVATPEQAQEIHKYIRVLIAEKYGQSIADDTTILYGGSCKPSNAKELFENPDVDGGLIGGASLKADDFLGIITAF